MTALPRKFCIIGPAGSGKDTAADFICELSGLTKQSSSYHVKDYAYDKYLKEGIETHNTNPPTFKDSQDFWERRDHPELRSFWFEKIVQYNTPDPSRLAREITRDFDIYTGMRSLREYRVCEYHGIFSTFIWIDSKVLPDRTLELSRYHAHISIENHGTKEELHARIFRYLLGCGLLTPAAQEQWSKGVRDKVH